MLSVMICWNVLKNSLYLLIPGSLEKFEKLVRALEFEVLLVDGVAIVPLCLGFFSA